MQNKDLTSAAGKQALEIPEHRRPIVAFLYRESERALRAPMKDPRTSLRAGFVSAQGEPISLIWQNLIPPPSRVERALMGMRIGLALGGGGAQGNCPRRCLGGL